MLQKMCLAIVVFISLSLSGGAYGYKFVDLSHDQSSSTLYWPGVPSFNRSVVMAGKNDKNIWIEVGVFSSGEHGGTHIDVPRHFFSEGYDLKDFPLEDTVAEGVMIDCRTEAAGNPDYAMPLSKITEWEEKNGRIPNEAAVLIYFGWAQKFHDHETYLGTSDVNDAISFHFPYVKMEAIEWLVENRNVKMVGLDVPSPDQPQDDSFPVHLTLLPKKKMILENVNIQPTLPPRNFRLHAAPIKIEGGTGTQTRIYAMLYDRYEGNSAMTVSAYTSVSAAVCIVFITSIVRLLCREE